MPADGAACGIGVAQRMYDREVLFDRELAGRMTQSGKTSRLVALCFDANDPLRLAGFWADALHWEIDDETHDEIGLVPTDDTRFRIEFQAVPEHKAGKNRIHLDLTSTSIDDQKETVERLVELGARHIDIGQGPDAEHVVLADPEGNEFCVIEPDNSFLADCGRFGSITCDGSPEIRLDQLAKPSCGRFMNANGEIYSSRFGTREAWDSCERHFGLWSRLD